MFDPSTPTTTTTTAATEDPLLVVQSTEIDIAGNVTDTTMSLTTNQQSATSMQSWDEVMAVIRKDNKQLNVSSYGDLIKSLLFLPVWLIGILPVSVVYQIGRFVASPIYPRSPSAPSFGQLDSGYDTSATTVTPRADRAYDVVVLGCTGFTGKLAASYLAKTYGVGKSASVRWALAGRSASKLNKVKEQLATELKNKECLDIPTILADTSIPSTLPGLVNQTRCVASTAGPFAFYGNALVEFCAKFGTHYVDTTGEVGWGRAMLYKWSATAQKTGAICVSFCGNDSIPWDLCVHQIKQTMQAQGDELESVTFWDDIQAKMSGGTLATVKSAVEMTTMSSPQMAPFDPFLTLPGEGVQRSPYVTTSKLWMSFIPGWSFCPFATVPVPSTEWTLPFVLADVNYDIVRRSHALAAKSPTQEPKSFSYKEFMVAPDWKTALCALLELGSTVVMLLNPITEGWHFQSGQGPSPRDMDERYFLRLRGEGIGRLRKTRVQVLHYIPRDPFYKETARMLVESGLCLALSARSSTASDNLLPIQGKGGFYSPAAAMGNVLAQRLINTGSYMATRVVGNNKDESKQS